MNQNKEKFEWDNDELSNDDELMEEAPMTHPTLLAELPGIVEENDFSNDDAPVQEIGPVDDSILAEQAAANANLTQTTGVLHEITGVTNGLNIPMIPDDSNDGKDEDSEYANNTPFAIEHSKIEDLIDDDAYNNDTDNNKEFEKEEEAVDVNNENEKTEESEDEVEEELSQSASNEELSQSAPNHYNLQKNRQHHLKQ